MSRRLLREGDPPDTSAQIVQGGCYAPSPWDAPRFKSPPNPQPASRRWVVVAVVALVVLLLFAMRRYFSRR